MSFTDDGNKVKEMEIFNGSNIDPWGLPQVEFSQFKIYYKVIMSVFG